MIVNKRESTLILLFAQYSNTIFAIVSGLFFVPMYLNYISTSTYGSWLASGNLLNLLSFIEGGLSVVFAQRTAHYFGSNQQEEFVETVSAGLILGLLISIFISISGILLSAMIPSLVKSDVIVAHDVKFAFIFATLGAGISLFHSQLICITRAWHLNLAPSIFGILAALGGLLSILISMRYFNFGVIALGFGAFVRSLINLVGTSIYVMYKWKFLNQRPLILKFHVLKDLYRATIPLLTTNIIGVLLNNSKELLLAILMNPASVTILSITGRIFSLISIFVGPITSSFFTALSSISNNLDQFISWASKLKHLYMLVSSLTFCTGLSLSAYFVSIWVGSDKYGGVFLAAILCINSWLITRCNFYIMLLNAKGIFRPTALISLVDIIIRIILISILVLLKVDFKIIYLPLIECLSISISSFMLSFYFESLLKMRIDKRIKSMLSFITQMVIGITIAYVFSNLVPVISHYYKWELLESLFFSLAICLFVSLFICFGLSNNRNFIFSTLGLNKFVKG